MEPEGMAAVLQAPTQMCFSVFYKMLLLLSLMTGKSFWTSEQRLLTSNWTKIFSLMSPTRRIYCFVETRPNPRHQHGEKTEKKAEEGGVPCKNLLTSEPPLPLLLLAKVQSLENKLDDLRLRLS
jgi:hypothetical protein